jgi:hypothetical protein
MADIFDKLPEKLGDIAGKWTAYAAFASFLLYAIGYLALRFQVSTFGLAVDLDLFDEKYLFAGCRFLVFLVASLPNILIILLVPAAAVYIPFRLIRAPIKAGVRQSVASWCAKPYNLPVLGIVTSVLFIQFIMRKCFGLGNLLLQKAPPAGWIASVLLASNGKLALYFSGLVVGTLLTAILAQQAVVRRDSASSAAKCLVGTLVFLAVVEFLLLPVNYGVLISTQQLPEIAEIAGNAKLLDGQRAWIVWQNKEDLTYFIDGPSDQRILLTVPRKDSPIRIVAYDDIFCVLFSSDHSLSRPCSR